MKKIAQLITYITIVLAVFACADSPKELPNKSATDVLGNPEYLAISYGGYRQASRDKNLIREL